MPKSTEATSSSNQQDLNEGELMDFLTERCMPFTGFSGMMLGLALVCGCYFTYIWWYYHQRGVFRRAAKEYGEHRKKTNSTRTGIEVAIAIPAAGGDSSSQSPLSPDTEKVRATAASPEPSHSLPAVLDPSSHNIKDLYIIPHHLPTLPGDPRTQRVFFFDLTRISAGMGAAVLINMFVIAQLLLVSLGDGRNSLDISSSPMIFDNGNTIATAAPAAAEASSSNDSSTTNPTTTQDPTAVRRRQHQLDALRDEVFLPMTTSFDGMSWWSAVFLSDALIGVPIAILSLKLITSVSQLILRLIRERRYTALLLGLDEDPSVSHINKESSTAKGDHSSDGEKKRPKSMRKYLHSRLVGQPFQKICQMISVSGRYNFEEDLEPYNPKNKAFWDTLIKERQEAKRHRKSLRQTASDGKLDEVKNISTSAEKSTEQKKGVSKAASPVDTGRWWSPSQIFKPIIKRLYSVEERTALADDDRMDATYDNDLMSLGGQATGALSTSNDDRPQSFYSFPSGTVAERVRLLRRSHSTPNILGRTGSYGSINLEPSPSAVTAGTMRFEQTEKSPESGLFDPGTLAQLAERAHREEQKAPSSPLGDVEDKAARSVPRFSWLFAQVCIWVFCTLVSRFIVVGITFWSIDYYKSTCEVVGTAIDPRNLCYAHEEAYHLFRHTTVKYSDVRAVLRERLKKVDQQAPSGGPPLTEVLPPNEVLRAYEIAVWQAHVSDSERSGDDLLEVQSKPDKDSTKASKNSKKGKKGSEDGKSKDQAEGHGGLPSAKQQEKSRSRLTPTQLAPPHLRPSFIPRNPIVSIAYVFQRLADYLTCDERQWVLGGGMRVASDLLSLLVIDMFSRFA